MLPTWSLAVTGLYCVAVVVGARTGAGLVAVGSEADEEFEDAEDAEDAVDGDGEKAEAGAGLGAEAEAEAGAGADVGREDGGVGGGGGGAVGAGGNSVSANKVVRRVEVACREASMTCAHAGQSSHFGNCRESDGKEARKTL